MTSEAPNLLDNRIAEWRGYLQRSQAIHANDVDELEDHLRNRIDDLRAAGLDDDEAFLIAVRRVGELHAVSREFAREYSERLWKRLVFTAAPLDGDTGWNTEGTIAILLAVAAAACVRIPELFGLRLGGDDGLGSFYLRNFALLVLPFLAAFFAWKRALEPVHIARLAVAFVAAFALMNAYPFAPGGHTELLSALHLPIALWLTVGYAYVAGQWRSHGWRMNFIRFSGEWFIYFTLIALGGGVLTGFTLFVFETIGLDAEHLVANWVIPAGVAGAVIIAAWLVEAKQSVVENMAPVLTLLFTPLFTLALLAFIGAVLWTGTGIGVEREILIGFDLLLVLVVGLILYAISARDPHRGPGFFDALQVALIACALIVDGLALWAIADRISTFGYSPNRLAALGLNVILVVNLARAAVLHGRFLAGRGTFDALARWQTTCLPVYAAWAWVVAALFPLVFRFV
ncbi:MAG: permease prefix domain 1-containing protein [Xanthomonadales bacterium]